MRRYYAVENALFEFLGFRVSRSRGIRVGFGFGFDFTSEVEFGARGRGRGNRGGRKHVVFWREMEKGEIVVCNRIVQGIFSIFTTKSTVVKTGGFR